MTVDLDPKAAGLHPARLVRIDEHLQRDEVDTGRIAGTFDLRGQLRALTYGATDD